MNLAAPTGRISVKCYVQDVKEICWTNPDLVQMGQKYHGTLHEDLCTACWQQHKITIKSISSSRTVNCLMCLPGRLRCRITLLRYTYIAYLVIPTQWHVRHHSPWTEKFTQNVGRKTTKENIFSETYIFMRGYTKMDLCNVGLGDAKCVLFAHVVDLNGVILWTQFGTFGLHKSMVFLVETDTGFGVTPQETKGIQLQ